MQDFSSVAAFYWWALHVRNELCALCAICEYETLPFTNHCIKTRAPHHLYLFVGVQDEDFVTNSNAIRMLFEELDITNKINWLSLRLFEELH